MKKDKVDELLEDIRRDRIAKRLNEVPEKKRTLKTLKDISKDMPLEKWIFKRRTKSRSGEGDLK